jgi:hypothetical protein
VKEEHMVGRYYIVNRNMKVFTHNINNLVIRQLQPYLRTIILRTVKPKGKISFIKNYIPFKGKLLDVGCGNNSPILTKNSKTGY